MSIPQQTKYDRWSDKIIEMKMKCERRSKGKECKKTADLRKIKKKIRKIEEYKLKNQRAHYKDCRC